MHKSPPLPSEPDLQHRNARAFESFVTLLDDTKSICSQRSVRNEEAGRPYSIFATDKNHVTRVIKIGETMAAYGRAYLVFPTMAHVAFSFGNNHDGNSRLIGRMLLAEDARAATPNPID